MNLAAASGVALQFWVRFFLLVKLFHTQVKESYETNLFMCAIED